MDSVVEKVWQVAERLYAQLERLPTQDEIAQAATAAGIDKYEANNRARAWLIFIRQFEEVTR